MLKSAKCHGDEWSFTLFITLGVLGGKQGTTKFLIYFLTFDFLLNALIPWLIALIFSLPEPPEGGGGSILSCSVAATL